MKKSLLIIFACLLVLNIMNVLDNKVNAENPQNYKLSFGQYPCPPGQYMAGCYTEGHECSQLNPTCFNY
jgi:hypothetical protein